MKRLHFRSGARLPRGATDAEVVALLGDASAHGDVSVLELDDAEDILGGFEDTAKGEYIQGLLFAKVLYGSWCCSRTNFHHPGATAFFERPAVLPLGSAATAARQARAW